jgi:hypothetical protein
MPPQLGTGAVPLKSRLWRGQPRNRRKGRAFAHVVAGGAGARHAREAMGEVQDVLDQGRIAHAGSSGVAR